ncbi:type II toxin-antitoxin system HicA family toxin [Orbus mooreae]|uniref:type II toxin-antitoxin system HicA family toxin n=1 Tax=Orbus mooreae TaxID=3074107 RepID=UPI00370D83B8
MSSKTATSHEKWIGYRDGRKLVVTVDKHEQPFDVFLISSMSSQAGMKKKEFFELCKGRKLISKLSHLIVNKEP